MVLTTANSGKYFTRKWNEERGRCMMDSSNYTDAEKEYYEVQGQNVYEGTYQQLEDSLSNLQTDPLDPLTTPIAYDQRSKPEVGY